MNMQNLSRRVLPNSVGAALGGLALILISLTGCQPVQAQVLDEIDSSASADNVAPTVERRFSPSYYRDDPRVIYGVIPTTPEAELRFSPSYYRDDPSVIYGVVPAAPAVELRISPFYYREDPSVIYGYVPPTPAVERRFSPSYYRDDPSVISRP